MIARTAAAASVVLLGVLAVLVLAPGGPPPLTIAAIAGPPARGELMAPDESAGGFDLFPTSGPGGTVVVVTGEVETATAVAVGTASELAAGTVPSFSRCAGSEDRPGCFTVSSGTLQVPGVPEHGQGATRVQLQTPSGTTSLPFTYTGETGSDR